MSHTLIDSKMKQHQPKRNFDSSKLIQVISSVQESSKHFQADEGMKQKENRGYKSQPGEEYRINDKAKD
jgi:hypothetical protein